MKPLKFALAICTYKRPHLLERLISDISAQTVLPDFFIVVDGQPADGEVLKVVENKALEMKRPFIYQPSNHANLAYQRYLAWRQAAARDTDYLLYLDDDLRFENPDIIREMLEITSRDASIAGLTVDIKHPLIGKHQDNDILRQRGQKNSGGKFSFLRKFGASASLKPGSLTPAGHRVMPVFEAEKELYRVDWLRGGVMLYSMKCLDQKCFSNDLFALTHAGCGLGEDTFLSRQAGRKGKLFFLRAEGIQHPNEDLPKAYPVNPFRFGVASAYSRRFLNDHYRYPEKPLFRDRLALLRTYLGEAAVCFIRFLAAPCRARAVYLGGYLSGCFKGIFVSPKASVLTPQIDWRGDAEKALKNAVKKEISSENVN